jgi:hypothetical protein
VNFLSLRTSAEPQLAWRHVLLEVSMCRDPREWHFRELLITLKVISKDIASPLLSRYWSTTPYRLGTEHVVKYSARPCDGESDGAGDDYLTKVLAAHLGNDDACFEFLIQAQTDARQMPTEDATIEWDDEDSPFLKAGVIRIPVPPFEYVTHGA